MPLYGSRHYSLKVPYAFPMPGKNQASYHDDIISGELSQIGTQFDGLGHVGIGELFYNGNRKSDFADARRLEEARRRERRRHRHARRAHRRREVQGRAASAGAVRHHAWRTSRARCSARRSESVRATWCSIHTGWGSLWMKDNATFGASSPGIGVAAGEWLAEQRSGRGGLRQLGRRGLPESRCQPVGAGAPAAAGAERHLPSREPRDRRAGARQCLRVRLRLRAAAAQRRDRARRATRSRSADHEGR